MRLASASCGIVSAGVAVGVAELAAAAIGPRSAPVVAVGAAVIDLTPRPVKEFAIRTFGENDKIALLAGIYTLLALFAIVVGLLALWRTQVGAVGVLAFGFVGAAASMTRPGADLPDTAPSLIGAAVGIVTLLILIRLLTPPRDDQEHNGVPAIRAGATRRGFLSVGASAIGLAIVAGGAGRLLQRRFDVDDARRAIFLPPPSSPAPPLPTGTQITVTELTPFYTPLDTFYRVDTALVVPQVSPQDWSLRIHGRVASPMTLTYDDLLGRDLIERDITLACVSNEVGGNLAGTARWLGVPLGPLLDEVQPAAGADQLLSTSVDGWTCGTPTEICRDGRDAMLAVGMNGEPLPVERGFPVRMLIPGLYGYVSATKWLVDLELTSFSDVDPYWVQRGWKPTAPIKTFSRIDTPRPLSRSASGRIAVAGVAWAQHRGIDRVEVRVDGTDWTSATLAAEATVDTWRQWTWAWDATSGIHTIECRATDRTGKVQTEQRVPPFPNGATGWHSVVVTVE